MIIKKVGFFTFDDDFFILQIIRKIKTEEDYKRLFSNFVSLVVLQAANYLFPLITFPYLVRILGVGRFGLIAFAQAFIQYFIIITDYGFNLSATREISINRDNKEKVDEIFLSVMMIKIFLLIMCFILMSVVVFSFEKFRNEWILYYLTFGVVLGQVFFPVWFFQGMEQMKWIVYMNVVAKGLFTLAVFIFVKSSEDYYKVPLLNSMGFVVAGAISFYVVLKKYRIKLYALSKKVIDLSKSLFMDSTYLFLSSASITMFNATNIFVLGLLVNNSVVGYYSISDKIIGALIATQVPVTHSLFPYLAREIKNNEDLVFRKLKFVLKVGVSFYFLIAVLILAFGKFFLLNIFGSDAVNSYNSLAVMSFIPFLGFINNIYGNQVILSMGKYSLFLRSIIYAALINVFFVFPLSYIFHDSGAAFSKLSAEIVFAYSCYYFAKRKLGMYL